MGGLTPPTTPPPPPAPTNCWPETTSGGGGGGSGRHISSSQMWAIRILVRAGHFHITAVGEAAQNHTKKCETQYRYKAVH